MPHASNVQAIFPNLCFTDVDFELYEGALKATRNRGLQPALDHIVENEGKPVPDLSGLTADTTGTSRAPMDVDGDEDDLEALRGMGVAGVETTAEAKVCQVSLPRT